MRGVGRGGEFGYASPGDADIAAGELYSDLFNASASTGDEVLFLGSTSDFYVATASAGADVMSND